jgi:replicative DNA helicase
MSNEKKNNTLLASVGSEKEVIKILLKFPTFIKEVSVLLEIEDFYIFAHKFIYKRLLELDKRNIVPDVQTIQKIGEEIPDINTLLKELQTQGLETDKLHSYINHIKECAGYRAIIELSPKIKQISENEELDIEQKKEEIEKTVHSSLTKNTTIVDCSVSSAVQDTKNKLIKAKNKDFGIRTGIQKLDSRIIGLEEGETVMIGARTSVGKSLLAGQMALNMALKGIGVVFVSYEMARDQLVRRMLSSMTGIDHTRITINNLSQEEEKKINEAFDILAQLPMAIIDDAGTKLSDIRSKVYRLPFKPKALYIDYIQLVPAVKKNSNRYVEVGSVSHELKHMANKSDLNLTVIALAQLSRSIEQRTNGIPKLSDFRECGDIEQDADRVIALTRGREQTYINTYILKQRNFPTVPEEALDIPVNFNIQRVG